MYYSHIKKYIEIDDKEDEYTTHNNKIIIQLNTMLFFKLVIT